MLAKHRASMKIRDSLVSSDKILETYLNTNDIDKVISMAEMRSENDIFHSSLRSMYIMLKACITFDPEDLNKVPKTTLQTIQLCEKYKRKPSFGTRLKFWKTPDYNKYEEIELHAEMTYAMIMGQSALLGLIKCHNLIELIRMINRLWICNKSFKEMKVMFRKRTDWETDISRSHFEAGIRLERALRNIFISYLSPKLLRVVNFLGLKGYRNVGFSQLNKTAFELSGFYSQIAETTVLLYWMYVETHGSLGPKNLNLCEKIINKKLEAHPNSFPYKFFSNKLLQLNGNIELSIMKNKQLLFEMGNHILSKLCHWEIMWSCALLCDWNQCIKYSSLVHKHALHSPAIFAYLEAIFRYVEGREQNNQQLIDEAVKLLEIVPDLRNRYLGKTITFEKLAVDYAKFFFQNNNFLLFPVMDILYGVNMFYLIDGNIEPLQRFMLKVEKEAETYSKTIETDCADNYLNAIFYKGVILKHMKQYTEAQQCFQTVINEKKRIKHLISMPPQSLMELGLIQMCLNNFEESKSILNKVFTDYSDYMSEHLVHIRCYSALREMGVNTDNDNECEVNIMKVYANAWLNPEQCEIESNNSAEVFTFEEDIQTN